VRLNAYVWNGSAWELKTTFLDDGQSGISSWDLTPRILTPGQVVISNEKEGKTRYHSIQAGTLP